MAEEEDLITNIELKNSVYYYGGMEEKVIDMICEYGLEDRIILSSFNNASIVLCRQSDETIAGGFLVEKYVDNAGVYARTCDVQYYHPNLEYLKEEHVRSCSQNGIGVNVWTVNEEEDMRRMKQWGSKLHHHQLSGQRKSSGRRGLMLRCKDAFCEAHAGGRLFENLRQEGGPAADL